MALLGEGGKQTTYLPHLHGSIKIQEKGISKGMARALHASSRTVLL